MAESTDQRPDRFTQIVTEIVIARNERLTMLARLLQRERRQAAKARQDQARRYRRTVRLRNRVESLNRELRTMRESSISRYTAPLRRLIEGAKHAKARREGSKLG